MGAYQEVNINISQFKLLSQTFLIIICRFTRAWSQKPTKQARLAGKKRIFTK